MNRNDLIPPADREMVRQSLTGAIRGQSSLAVYNWRAWEGFLIKQIAPNAISIPADPFDDVESITHRLPTTPGVLLFHINCSVTRAFPLKREDLLAALKDIGWTLCNENLVDITKRGLQDLFVEHGCRSVRSHPQDSSPGFRVVKSNLNYGGTKERELPEDIQRSLGIHHLTTYDLDASSYRAVPRSEISRETWDDPSVAVERFIGNKDGYYFRVSLAGDKVHLVQLQNQDSIKKVGRSRLVGAWAAELFLGNPLPDPLANGVLDEVSRVSNALQMDFGAMDVVLNDDGEAHVVDVNATPWFNTVTYFPGMVSHLSGNPRLEKRPGAHPSRIKRIFSRFRPQTKS